MIGRSVACDRDDRGGTSPMTTHLIARPGATRTVERAQYSGRVGARAADSCGNGASMEITERFPQPLGNLAKSARFPHSHNCFSGVDQKNTDQHTEPDPRLSAFHKEVLDSRPAVRTR
jgi:hypothetical protein